MRNFPITFENRTGAKITTSLTGEEAEAIVKHIESDFAASLWSSFKSIKGLRGDQSYWFYKIAEDNNPENKNKVKNGIVNVGAGFLKVAEMFKAAENNGIQKPKIRLQTENGSKIQLSLAAETSSNPNFIYIKNNGVYQGKISPLGIFSPARECSIYMKDYLTNFAEDPKQAIISYGKITGCCSFCARTLTDKRSLEVSYGPWCADKYNLPWGN